MLSHISYIVRVKNNEAVMTSMENRNISGRQNNYVNAFLMPLKAIFNREYAYILKGLYKSFV